jgi:hypothetical protein
VFAFKLVIIYYGLPSGAEPYVCNSQTFLAQLDSVAETCNYAGYLPSYPPNGLLPLPGASTEYDDGCDVWDMIFDAALLVNPAFNEYRIFDTVSGPFLKPPRSL